MKLYRTFSALALPVLLVGGCSGAGEQRVASAPEIHEPDEVTCRSVVKTGTRVGSKVCKTNRAWAESSRRAQEYAERITRKSGQNQTISGQ